MAQKLVCLTKYVNGPRGLVYEAGQVFDASSSLREFLLGDAPGSFEDYVPKRKARRKPPRNKAVEAAQEVK